MCIRDRYQRRVRGVGDPCKMATPKTSSFFDTLGQKFDSFLTESTLTIDRLLDTYLPYLDNDAESRFYSHFTYPESEKVLCEIPTQVISANKLLDAVVYLSSNYLSFIAYDGVTKLPVKFPYTEVLQLQESTGFYSKTAPHLPPLVLQHTQYPPDCVQIFTSDKLVHHFFFANQKNYQTFLQILTISLKQLHGNSASFATSTTTTTTSAASTTSVGESKEYTAPTSSSNLGFTFSAEPASSSHS
eukprot:TRINITY_DN243_c0_g1_i8.p1 TRINITY_DN243_c0_g1~~TRINITY_DN243_c0_g1_i8.p1  ORF type:complete len:244 (-),score=52.18 TRINITY_DN243_c0_g1_i8:134-865(-)